MTSNDVCEHQNANYLRMMSERDTLRAEVERLREGIFAAATVLNREFYRLPAPWVGRLAADLRALLAGSGEQPGEAECEECEAIARMIYSDPSDLTGPCSRHSHDRPAPVVPDGGNAHEPGDDEHTPGVNVTQPAVPDSADVRYLAERIETAMTDDGHRMPRTDETRYLAHVAAQTALAVVGQGVTAEGIAKHIAHYVEATATALSPSSYRAGIESAVRLIRRWRPEYAAARPTGQEGS